MSTLLTKPLYSAKQQEINWMNNIFHTHDLLCGCTKPILHLLTIINKTSEAPKPESEIENIQCLLTGKGTTTGTEDHGFDEGDLERIFAEDTQEDTG